LELIDNNEQKDLPKLTPKQAIQLHTKCMVLMKAYEYALINMGSKESGGWTWMQCCESATSLMENVGLQKVSNETVRRSNVAFRKIESFLHPQALWKPTEPKLFSIFPEVKFEIHKFCTNPTNLETLSVEKVREHLVDNLIPNLHKSFVEAVQDDPECVVQEGEIPDEEEFLAGLNLQTTMLESSVEGRGDTCWLTIIIT